MTAGKSRRVAALQQPSLCQKLSDTELELSQPHTLPLVETSGASSGEFNSDSTTATAQTATPTSINIINNNNSNNNNRLRQLPTPWKAFKHNDTANGNTNENTSDNSSSSLSTTTNSLTSSSFQTSSKSNDLQRSSSSASSGIAGVAAIATNIMRERKKANSLIVQRMSPETDFTSGTFTATAASAASDRSQRRKLMQLITSYDQQNKQLQRDLARERRRRSEELACVVKSLLCFESKLRADMKIVHQRLRQRDAEICRLVRHNRMLQTQLQILNNAKNEGVEEDAIAKEEVNERKLNTQIDVVHRYDDNGIVSSLKSATADCLVSEALQCFSCQQEFYDIELKENWSQTDGGDCRNTDEHTTEHGSSSDDTHSSSFYGARRSIRYTSKRTCGTFRDYMRSRSMHIDDDNDNDDNGSGGGGFGNGSIGSNSCDCNGDGNNGVTNDNEMVPYDNFEEEMSAISRNDSQHSYEKMNVYSHTIDRMHGVKSAAELRPFSRSSTKSSSGNNKISDSSTTSQFEEDDGIFTPTHNEDFDKEEEESAKTASRIVTMIRTETLRRTGAEASPLLGGQANGSNGQCDHFTVVENRSTEFSEASPKQIYETSTDDWYASVSDQEEAPAALKPYGHNAVNPVLECVNQILLQQEMEEPLHGCSTRTLSARNVNECETFVEMIATPMRSPSKVSAHTSAAMLPRRSSLSGRLSSRSNSQLSDGQPAARIGTLATRKRVHFSTKNSLVHVPRNDDLDDESNGDDVDAVELMPALSPQLLQCHPLQYFSAQLRLATQSPQSISATPSTATPTTVIYASQQREDSERLDTLNYESIYSNEYEHIGSENNGSSLYVDMESTTKSADLRSDAKLHKMPPALPPKPANLLKFKKSLQQLDEVPDEHLVQEDGAESVATTFEPDYCSISEVNVTGIRNVQIVADIHKAPDSEPDVKLAQTDVIDARKCNVDIEDSTVASVHSEDTCDNSHKTDDIEEILADIPKLPNVAAIIAPRNACKYHHHLHLDYQPTIDHYLVMSSKSDTTSPKARQGECILASAPSAINATGDLLKVSRRSPKMCAKTANVTPITLPLPLSLISNSVSGGSGGNVVDTSSRTYGQKYLPNILAEINKRMHSFPTSNVSITPSKGAPQPLPKKVSPFSVTETEAALTASLPLLQAEFDWYNLDAEYGKASFHSASASLSIQNTPDILKVSENHSSVVVLEEIHEDHESIVAAADEYNLDEEFSLQDKEQKQDQQQANVGAKVKGDVVLTTSDAAIFSSYGETPTLVQPAKGTKKKIKKNLANFEKFIEGSGLSTKALPNKRKIYFSGPFV